MPRNRVYVPRDNNKKPEGRKNRSGALEKVAREESITVKTTTTQISTTTTIIKIANFNPGEGYHNCSSADIQDIQNHGYFICTKMIVPYLHNRNQTVRGLCRLSAYPCTYTLQESVDPKKSCGLYNSIRKRNSH